MRKSLFQKKMYPLFVLLLCLIPTICLAESVDRGDGRTWASFDDDYKLAVIVGAC